MTFDGKGTDAILIEVDNMENANDGGASVPQKNRLFLIGGGVLLIAGLALLFAGAPAVIFCPLAGVGAYLLYEYRKSK